jgi:hypothetical protein
MRFFAARRLRNTGLLLLALLLLGGAATILAISLSPVNFYSGWLLLGLVLLLTAYNLRKRFPFLPLGNSASWLQLHVYAGLLAGFVFLVHLGWGWPGGGFEILLAATFATVFLSGVLGLVLTRTFPPRLATRGEEVLFERIPAHRQRIREEVERMILEYTSRSDTSAVPDFYVQRVKPFFDRPRNVLFHLLHSGRPLNKLLLAIHSQQPYLNEPERELMQGIAERVRVKDDLDYQYTLQATLKYWLFVHVPLTYGLLVFVGLHVFLVWRFAGRLL